MWSFNRCAHKSLITRLELVTSHMQQGATASGVFFKIQDAVGCYFGKKSVNLVIVPVIKLDTLKFEPLM